MYSYLTDEGYVNKKETKPCAIKGKKDYTKQ